MGNHTLEAGQGPSENHKLGRILMNSSVPKGPPCARGPWASLGGLSGGLQLSPIRKRVLESAPHSLVSAKDLTSCFFLHSCWVLLSQSVQLRSCPEPQEKKKGPSWVMAHLNAEFRQENLSSQPSRLGHCWLESPGSSKAPGGCCPVPERERNRGHWSPKWLQGTSSPGCSPGGSLSFR